jgi:5-methylcytosine-specific restriction endonuclease McrA
MKKEIRLERILNNLDKPIPIRDYAILLKLTGFTMDEALNRVERLAIRDGIEKIHLQTMFVVNVYFDDKIKRSRYTLSRQHTEEEWENKKKQYGYACAYCGKTNVKLTKDHIVPIVLGGTGEIDNIAPACMPCNRKKGFRKVEYFKEELQADGLLS